MHRFNRLSLTARWNGAQATGSWKRVLANPPTRCFTRSSSRLFHQHYGAQGRVGTKQMSQLPAIGSRQSLSNVRYFSNALENMTLHDAAKVGLCLCV